MPTVRVRRAGKVQELSARELVPGDIVQLEAGNVAPADARLLEVNGLKVKSRHRRIRAGRKQVKLMRLSGQMTTPLRWVIAKIAVYGYNHQLRPWSGRCDSYGHGH
ncbi:MAG: hypothetical protein R2932_53515 [Caldilineaceae bacterium]